jgi:ABC-type branched-subunit amino acid transport system substrate-binding protein
MKNTSDEPADVFAAQSWSAMKAFFDSLEQLKGPISRDALLAQLRAQTKYDAGGLLGEINFAGDVGRGCFVGMRFEGGRWRRFQPADGFLC